MEDTLNANDESKDRRRGLWHMAAMFLLGVILWTTREYVDPYSLIRAAAALHLVGALVKTPELLKVAFLTPGFALYTVILTDQVERYPILAIIVMGGVFEIVVGRLRSESRRKRLLSSGCAVLILLVSYTVTTVPDVLLQEKPSASIASEYSFFFFRSDAPRITTQHDGVVVWQDPAPAGFPANLRPCFAESHAVFSFLPFPVWPTLKYRLGERPVIKITHLRPDHGINSEVKLPAQCNKENCVTQFHRIYGAFRNLDRSNNHLHLRVLVKPITSVSRLQDKTRRYWAQPHDASNQDAQLKLIYDDSSSGTWYCDVFFGAPQNVGTRYEVRAVITSRDFRRGQRIRPDEVDKMVQACDRLIIVRER